MNELKKIVSYVNPPVVNKSRFVVQKYIGNITLFVLIKSVCMRI